MTLQELTTWEHRLRLELPHETDARCAANVRHLLRNLAVAKRHLRARDRAARIRRERARKAYSNGGA